MEAQQGRRAARGKARDLILPGSAPVPLREESHGDLWQAMDGVRERLSNLEGKMTVLLGIAAATFLGVFGLMLAMLRP